MLSRAAILSIQRQLGVLAARTASSVAAGGDRVSHPKHPSKVRLGLVPKEWFQSLYNKTGVGVGLITYFCFKENYVMKHEYYSCISLAIMAFVAIKKLGLAAANWADKEIDRIEVEWKRT